MATAYGKDFSAIYNAKWDLWARKMWPFLMRVDVAGRRRGGGKWLDLCCGSGTLLELASARGYETVGIDLSAHQLKYARQKAPKAHLLRGDIRELALPGRFDVITCIFDSLNYLVTLRDLERAIRRARRHLAEGGVFVFDVKTPRAFRMEQNKIFRDPRHVVIFQSSFEEKGAHHSFVVTGFIQEGGLYRRFAEEHVQRGYEAGEIERVLDRVALGHVKYDGETFSKSGPKSNRLLYACTRQTRRRKGPRVTPGH